MNYPLTPKILAIALIGVMLIVSYFIPYILAILIGIVVIFEQYKSKNNTDTKDQFKTDNYKRKPYINTENKNDPLKAKGDEYERHIGKRFEEKGDLVIYNGFIRGYEDGGVDLVAISPDGATINLIQCKSWHTMTMELSHIKAIHQKLSNHTFDFLKLPAEEIIKHQIIKRSGSEIYTNRLKVEVNIGSKMLTIRKTLYIASEKVVDLEVGKHLTMIKPNIFRYEDMKIVVEKI